MDIHSFFEEASELYSVQDLISEHTDMIFILESPHKEEIKSGVPLAGLSGRSMAKELFEVEESLPMGKLLKQYINENKKTAFGIVNVSSFPLQGSAFPDQSFVSRYSEEIKVAEAVRTSSVKVFKDEFRAKFDQLLLQHFETRLTSLLTENSLIVPCGRFAEKYVNKLSNRENLTVIEGVPHPSYHSWSRDRYQKVIDKVRVEGKKRTS
ncbi:hypothetical protein ABE65_009300 [Fictibacillus phosphorivorans]|uniref:Uracil-DNA glycosylase-like domain-containing protein n=1 Tax=Fictibacillus phosphorivorans TaxID=1221500 RepID=A0A160IL67_9BACL|nr:hypothetical protein [Fictibacillus phosphorivorans]ANC76988.1 hypothetical protein ABE65_009300 [Fictibacillus phosphorivorans]